MKHFSSKFFGVAIAVVMLATVTFAAPAAKPKATGDIDFINGPGGYNQQANLTFNAINTSTTGLGAKGSAIYTDVNITYAMDVQFLKVEGNTAWFAGQVTSVTDDRICCKVGNWMFFMVTDMGEPGINDLVWGEDLTNSGKIPAGEPGATCM
jgi:hypothetical protein